MVVKRRKTGNTTVTINTTTGRQTTSRRSGNITHSQSNQGHTRSTVTTNYGNGWFDRKTTNWNKKKRSKKSSWSLFGDGSSTTTRSEVKQKSVEEPRQPFVGPIQPTFFYQRKSFSKFTLWEWCKWFICLPFRIMWFMIRLSIAISIIVAIYNMFAM